MTNNCPNEKQVSAYADGELGVKDTARIKTHLVNCGNCRQELASYRNVDRMIHDLPEIEVTASFDRAFRERLETAKGRPQLIQSLKDLFTGWRPAWAAAAAMCLVMGIFFYSGHDREVLNPEDIIIVENMEFFQNFDFLQKMELLENWDAESMANDRS